MRRPRSRAGCRSGRRARARSPTLDPVTAAGIDRLIVDLRDALGITVVVVSHEVNSIRRTADQVTMLQEGVVMAEGTIQSLEQSPDPRISGFFRGTGAPAQRVPSDLFID